MTGSSIFSCVRRVDYAREVGLYMGLSWVNKGGRRLIRSGFGVHRKEKITGWER